MPDAESTPPSTRRLVLVRIVLGFYWVALALATHWPSLSFGQPPVRTADDPHLLLQFDKIEHLGAFGLLTLLIILARPLGQHRDRRSNAIGSVLIAAVYAVIDETTQGFFAERTVSASDLLTNLIAVVGVGVLTLSPSKAADAPGRATDINLARAASAPSPSKGEGWGGGRRSEPLSTSKKNTPPAPPPSPLPAREGGPEAARHPVESSSDENAAARPWLKFVGGLAIIVVGGWVLSVTKTVGRETAAMHFVAAAAVTLSALRRPMPGRHPRWIAFIVMAGVGTTIVVSEIAQGFSGFIFSRAEVFYGQAGLLLAIVCWSARLALAPHDDALATPDHATNPSPDPSPRA